MRLRQAIGVLVLIEVKHIAPVVVVSFQPSSSEMVSDALVGTVERGELTPV